MLLTNAGSNFDFRMSNEAWYTNLTDYFVLPDYDNFVLNHPNTWRVPVEM